MSLKADARKLTEAYALKIFSGVGATMRAQEKFHKAFEELHVRLAKKYPDTDLESGKFWDQLERAARLWWQSRPFRGPGVDW